MNEDIQAYNDSQSDSDEAICDLLAEIICAELPEAENKIWHRHPVWFLEGNPIVGYSRQKAELRLMFWRGAGFEEEEDLKPGTGKFKDASIFYTSAEEVDTDALKRWLAKSCDIQWDYKNIVRRKGRLERLV